MQSRPPLFAHAGPQSPPRRDRGAAAPIPSHARTGLCRSREAARTYAFAVSRRQLLPACCNSLHLTDFRISQKPILAARKRPQLQRPEPEPLELQDWMPHGLQHPLDLVGAPLGDRQFDPGILLGLPDFPDLSRAREAIFQPDARFQRPDLRVIETPANLHQIGLRDVST